LIRIEIADADNRRNAGGIAPMPLQTAHSLSSTLSGAWHQPLASGNYTVTVFALSAAVIGLACCYWAAWMHARLGNFRIAARDDQGRADAAIRFRDTLLAGGQEAIAVLGSDMKEPFFTGGGSELLQAAMAGANAAGLAGALDALLKNGTAFVHAARSRNGGTIAIRGIVIGQRAVLFLRNLGDADPTIDYRAALDALPAPIWIRGGDLALRWCNRAFLAAVGAGKLRDALASGVAIERSERELAAAARDGGDIAEARRYAAIGGRRRALSLNLARLPDNGVAGIAIDVTDAVQAEARLQLDAEANADVLDRTPLAIAVFDKDQRLASFNRAYAKMWNFAEAWLKTHPSQSDILERLREAQSLPEQRDFAAWKHTYLQLFVDCTGPMEEFWHLADGRSIRVVTQPHLLGGVFFLFEDVSERLRLEASFTMLTQVQRATLDALADGIAIFGPDGRLVLHNRAFAKLWALNEDELSGQPHLTKVANLAEARMGHDSIWSIVMVGVTSDEPERCAEWGKAHRADGRIISVSMSRLPNGATVVTFADLSEVKRYESEIADAAHAVA
jgi:PAS domain-containing protein